MPMHEWKRVPATIYHHLVSYRAAIPLLESTPEAFIEPFLIGAGLPDMPACHDTNAHVHVPLKPTYQAAWDVCSSDFRDLVEHGALPDEERAPRMSEASRGLLRFSSTTS